MSNILSFIIHQKSIIQLLVQIFYSKCTLLYFKLCHLLNNLLLHLLYRNMQNIFRTFIHFLYYAGSVISTFYCFTYFHVASIQQNCLVRIFIEISLNIILFYYLFGLTRSNVQGYNWLCTQKHTCWSQESLLG